MRFAGWLRMLIDSIMPPRARTERLRGTHALTPALHTGNMDGFSVTTLSPYHAPGMEDAIRALKYDGSARATKLLADALADFLREEIASMHIMSARPVLLVPVPLHRRRARERGFNQIERVLAQLPREFRDGTFARVETRALYRTRATPPQTKLSRAERLRNVRGAFSADPRHARGAHVLLIDDVCTTGATLRESATVLEKAGATVTAIALSRA